MKYRNEPFVVRLGSLARSGEDRNAQEYLIMDKIFHEDYTKSSHYNDIALVRLNRRVTFNDYVRPACLDDQLTPPLNATATGWGNTEYQGSDSDRLMSVKLDLADHKSCNERFINHTYKSQRLAINETTQVCYGSDKAKDTCQVRESHFELFSNVLLTGLFISRATAVVQCKCNIPIWVPVCTKSWVSHRLDRVVRYPVGQAFIRVFRGTRNGLKITCGRSK